MIGLRHLDVKCQEKIAYLFERVIELIEWVLKLIKRISIWMGFMHLEAIGDQFPTVKWIWSAFRC